MANSFYIVGVCFFNQREWDKAIKFLDVASEWLIKLKLNDKLIRCYDYLSQILIEKNNYKDALEHILLHLRMTGKSETTYEKSKAYLNIAVILTNMKKKDIWSNRKLLKQIHKLTGIKPKEKKYYTKVIDIALSEKDYETYVPALYQYGIYFYKKGKKKKARQHIELAYNKSVEHNMTEQKKDIEKLYEEMDL